MNAEKFVAQRMSMMSGSGIRRIFDLAATMKNPIDFSMGQPDFPVPQSAKDAAVKAIGENRNGYTVTHGIPDLRNKVAESLKAEFDWDPAVFITCGVSGGLTLAMLACVNPGDEVIIPDPYFVSYPHLIGLAGGKAVPVDTQPDFAYDAERIEKLITPKTRAILVNSPSNPCGVVYPADQVEKVCALAEKHDLLIISDEIYNLLSFDSEPASPVTYAPRADSASSWFWQELRYDRLADGCSCGAGRYCQRNGQASAIYLCLCSSSFPVWRVGCIGYGYVGCVRFLSR